MCADSGQYRKPNRYRTYLETHASAMARHCEGDFVVVDKTELQNAGDDFQSIEGNIRCRGSLYINVDKRLRCWRDTDGVMWTQPVHIPSVRYWGVQQRSGGGSGECLARTRNHRPRGGGDTYESDLAP